MDRKHGLKQVFDVTLSQTEILPIINAQDVKEGLQKCRILGCKGKPLITDNATGEIICGCCGSILSEKSVDVNQERTNDLEEFLTITRTGPDQSLSMYDMGMTTVISDKDAHGKFLSSPMKDKFGRLKRLNNRSRRASSSRTLRSALLFLNSIKTRLGLPDSVTENAAYIYRKAMQKKITVGRSAKCLMCACVYAACRQSAVPRSIGDISQGINIGKKEVSRAYRTLIEGLELNQTPYDASGFVAKIASEADISQQTRRDALEILRKITDKGLSDGKNPKILAATALYISCVLHGEYKTQAEIGKASGATANAIRIRYSAFKKELGLDTDDNPALIQSTITCAKR